MLRFSGGPAPYRIARAHVYENGCIQYEAHRTKRCVCENTDALKEVLEPQQVRDVVDAIRIVPRTLVDSEGIAVTQGELVGERANRDLPPKAQAWLTALDDALRPLIGSGYAPFLEKP